METGVFWLSQAHTNAPWPGAGWRRNSIPRYLNTSQLRVMYEGCVSYVYFCHFLGARIWMSSPSPVHSSQFIPARHRERPERPERRGMICIFGKKNRARCAPWALTRARALLQVRWPISHVWRRDKSFFPSSFQSFARHDRVTVLKLISLGMNVSFPSVHSRSLSVAFSSSFLR